MSGMKLLAAWGSPMVSQRLPQARPCEAALYDSRAHQTDSIRGLLLVSPYTSTLAFDMPLF